MSLVSRVSAVLSGVGQTTWRATQLRLTAAASDTAVAWPAHYAMLRAYYLQNGLYLDVSRAYVAQDRWAPAMANLRSPAYSVVEFHASKIWPDVPEVQTDNARLLDPLARIWQWSNWAHNRTVFLRWLAMYGDALIKISTRADTRPGQARVYFQLIEPQYATDLDLDERGYVTYLRLDVPQQRREGDETTLRMHTEVWDKATQTYRRWDHDQAADTELERLGPPADTQPFGAFGIDFVPFVHARFRDIGETRGVSAFLPAIDLIDEANRVATRLHQMAFRYGRPQWALKANANDATGRPLPAPRIGPGTGDGSDGDTITLGEDRLFRLPGLSELESLVPALPYEEMLNILQAQMRHMETVLPEMAYYRVRDFGSQLSGRAVRLLLADAVDRVLEARANAEDALVRADQMALTMGQWLRLDAFAGLGGTYSSGAFAHTFAPQDVLPADPLEDAQTDQARAEAAVKFLEAGWSQRAVWRGAGMSDTDMDLMQQERATMDVLMDVEQ